MAEGLKSINMKGYEPPFTEKQRDLSFYLMSAIAETYMLRSKIMLDPNIH
jgi:hypothetical protein